MVSSSEVDAVDYGEVYEEIENLAIKILRRLRGCLARCCVAHQRRHLVLC